MDRLSEQQERFKPYAKSGFYYHEPPQLSREVVEAMKREKLDDKYRFVWGGVAVIRDDLNNPKPIAVRGDRAACFNNSGWLMPKYLYRRVQQPIGFVYKTENGHSIHAAREDQIPAWVWAQQIVRQEYQYIEYGNLCWYIEQKASDAVDAKIPVEGWVTITPPLEDDAGDYYEPDTRCVNLLLERERQNRNDDLKQVAERDREQREQIRLAKETRKENESRAYMNEVYVDVIDFAAKNAPDAETSTELKKMSEIVHLEMNSLPE